MKTILLAVGLVVFTLNGCRSLTTKQPLKQTWSSFDLPSEHSPQQFKPGMIDFQGVDLRQVLEIYQAVSGRTVLRGALPDVKFVVRSQSPLTQIQVLRLLDTLLAENGVAMIPVGETTVQAVPIDRASSENPPEIDLPWRLLPESKSLMTRTVQLKKLKPSQVLPVLAPLAGLRNSIMAVDSQRLLILRDYSANIRRQLKLLEELELKPAN